LQPLFDSTGRTSLRKDGTEVSAAAAIALMNNAAIIPVDTWRIMGCQQAPVGHDSIR
jgi:hypothetical protein